MFNITFPLIDKNNKFGIKAINSQYINVYFMATRRLIARINCILSRGMYR